MQHFNKTIVKKNKLFMTKQDAKQIENQLTEMFKLKHPDIITHVDNIEGTDKIVITFFWNRISQQNFKDSKSFKMNYKNYKRILASEIITFFN